LSEIYDVFRKGPDGFEWIESVEGLQNARTEVKKMMSADPGHTYVYDLRRRTVVRQGSTGNVTLF
jgi:hypothetical protein